MGYTSGLLSLSFSLSFSILRFSPLFYLGDVTVLLSSASSLPPSVDPQPLSLKGKPSRAPCWTAVSNFLFLLLLLAFLCRLHLPPPPLPSLSLSLLFCCPSSAESVEALG